MVVNDLSAQYSTGPDCLVSNVGTSASPKPVSASAMSGKFDIETTSLILEASSQLEWLLFSSLSSRKYNIYIQNMI